MKIIAHIETDFKEKFGIPRQSGLVSESTGRIIFEKEYSVPEAFRGLEDFSHIWVLWQFSEAVREDWSPTVRPPLLGGNKRMGVFATRSPFRPNAIGLSALKLDKVEFSKTEGIILHVSGADLLDGTPIYDIKPYLPYADSIPRAVGGFTESLEERHLEVDFPESLLRLLPEDKRAAAVRVLSLDPRPAYQRDPERVYGLPFGGLEVRFRVADGVLRVEDISVGDHRDIYSLFHLADGGPVRHTGIHLGAGAAMDGHGGNTDLLQHNAQLHRVDTAFIPTPAHFHRHRNGARLDYGLSNAGSLLRILHQCAAVTVVCHLAHRTAHVDVDKGRAAGLCGDLRGLGHAGNIAAENLGTAGILAGEQTQQLLALFVLIAQSLGADQLRIGQTRAKLAADLAEGIVRDPRHRGQCQLGIDLHIADAHGVTSKNEKYSKIQYSTTPLPTQGRQGGMR